MSVHLLDSQFQGQGRASARNPQRRRTHDRAPRLIKSYFLYIFHFLHSLPEERGQCEKRQGQACARNPQRCRTHDRAPRLINTLN